MQDLAIETEKQSFKSDNVNITLTKKPGCKAVIEAEITPLAVQAAYEKAFKNVKREVSIAGFRKGKAPDDVVLKNYSTHIERECRDICLQTAFQEAIALCKLPPLNPRSVKKAQLKKCSKEEGAEALFEYEYEPVAPTIDPSLLKTKRLEHRPITDEDVEWELEREKMRLATFEEITDRPVQVGDYIEMDLDVIEHPVSNVFTSKLFHVTANTMPKWAFELVQGMKVDESREATATVEENDDKAFVPHVHTADCKHDHAPKLCRIIVTSIKKGILPEENDEFAKKLGAETMQDLKTKVRKYIERMAHNQAQEMTRSALVTELLQKYPIDLPEALVMGEANARFANVKRILEEQRGALPSDKNDEELKAHIYQLAKTFLGLMYLLNPIVREKQYTMTQDELMQEVTFETMYLPPEQRIVFAGMTMDEARNRLAMRIMIRKGLDDIIASLKT